MLSQLVAPELYPLIRRSRVQWMIVASSLLYVAEGIVTLPLPWIRLGISNLFVLVAARQLGWKAALTIAWGRTIIGGLATGQFFSPIFLINFGGTTVAALLMGGLSRLPFLSLIGVSTIAAWGHVWGQMFLAGWLWGEWGPVLGLAPLLLSLALLTGPAIGWLAEKAMVVLNSNVRNSFGNHIESI